MPTTNSHKTGLPLLPMLLAVVPVGVIVLFISLSTFNTIEDEDLRDGVLSLIIVGAVSYLALILFIYYMIGWLSTVRR